MQKLFSKIWICLYNFYRESRNFIIFSLSFNAMDQPYYVTKFLLKFMLGNFFILQNTFLKIWERLKNVYNCV